MRNYHLMKKSIEYLQKLTNISKYFISIYKKLIRKFIAINKIDKKKYILNNKFSRQGW